MFRRSTVLSAQPARPAIMPALVVAFAFALSLFSVTPEATACTSILVSKGASADGSTMITYSADSSTLYGSLNRLPAGVHPEGATRQIFDVDSGEYLGEIPEARETYAVLGYMNEHQLAIGETTFGGRPELMDPTGIIDYGSLMVLALQRAKTAREAIEVMTTLVAEHGYRSGGESFSIADPNEVWVLDLIGKGPGNKGAVWVARRVPDGYISAHANQSRIRTFPRKDPKNCIFAPDVVSFAREKGWFDGADADFSFADTYNPLDYGGLRICEARVWSVFRRAAPNGGPEGGAWPADYVTGKTDGKQTKGALPLFVKPETKLRVQDVMALMRDHYEGTELDLTQGVAAGPYSAPYRWRPLFWKLDGVQYMNDRPISTQQTGFSFVTQSRKWLPGPIGGIYWFGVDDTYTTVYVPLYCGIDSVPEAFSAATGSLSQFSWKSAFWVFNWVSNTVYMRWSLMLPDLLRVQRSLEGSFLAQQEAVEKAAHDLWKRAPRLAREYLTQYSHDMTRETMTRWIALGELLQVKFLDGYVKGEHGQVKQVGYPDHFKRRIVDEAGEHLRVHPISGELPSEVPMAPVGYYHSRAELGAWADIVPADFPFDREKLFLKKGHDKCHRPPQCCVELTPTDDGTKLRAVPPKSEPDKCGPRDWLVRVPIGETRPILTKASSGH